jgi:hypothetical protein
MTVLPIGQAKSNTRRAKTKHRGPTRVAADFLLNLIAYNVGPELKTTPEAARSAV